VYPQSTKEKVTGHVLLDEADIERSQVVAQIDVTAISTRNEGRDQHLKSAEFLDVAAHPTIEFRSQQVRELEQGQLQVTGALTIRGVARQAVLEAELSGEVRDPWGNVKRGVVATTKINRKDFGVSWNATMDGGGIVVSDTVEITIELELVKRAG
jgi:polyisoprenoid-binding protein YceI